MYERDIRWLALLPLAPLLAVLALAVEMAGLWPDFAARPDWLWILAFSATLHASPAASLVALAWCGAVRDVILGPKAGAAAIAFVLVGWLVQFWKPTIRLHGPLGHALAAGMAMCAAALVKHGLDWYGLAARLWLDNLLVSAGDAGLTALCYIPAAAALSLPGVSPWRERDSMFI